MRDRRPFFSAPAHASRRGHPLFCLRLLLFAGLWSGLVASTSLAGAQIERLPRRNEVNTQGYTVSGTVINSLTGEPINRALVGFYTGSGPRAVLTDRDGRFQFEGVPQMRTQITVRKPGFFNQQELSGGSWNSMVQVGPDMQPLILKLTPEAVITGHVKDEHGEPLEGAGIIITNPQIMQGRKIFQQRGGAATNQDGEFRVANLSPGTYYVAARVGGNRFQAEGEALAYPVTYYANAADRSEATPISLAAGQHAELEFSMKPAPAFQVSGVVSGHLSGPGTYLQILNKSGEDVSVGGMQLNPRTGRFQTRVIAGGFCILKAHSQDEDGRFLFAQTTLNVTSNVSDIRLHLAPEAFIPINVEMQSVRSSSGSAPDNIVGPVIAKGPRAVPPLSIQVHSVDHMHPDTWSMANKDADTPGLALQNVEPGRYHLEITANNPSWYVQSATYGGTDVLQEDLMVAAGDSQPIEVVMRDDVGSIAGTVNLSEDSQRTELLIVPDHAPQSARPMTSNGNFNLYGLAPGTYKIFAFDSIDGLEYTNPEALREYAAKAVEVTLEPEQKQQVKLDLIRRGEE